MKFPENNIRQMRTKTEQVHISVTLEVKLRVLVMNVCTQRCADMTVPVLLTAVRV
jgi:hypothetical protein